MIEFTNNLFADTAAVHCSQANIVSNSNTIIIFNPITTMDEFVTRLNVRCPLLRDATFLTNEPAYSVTGDLILESILDSKQDDQDPPYSCRMGQTCLDGSVDHCKSPELVWYPITNKLYVSQRMLIAIRTKTYCMNDEENLSQCLKLFQLGFRFIFCEQDMCQGFSLGKEVQALINQGYVTEERFVEFLNEWSKHAMAMQVQQREDSLWGKGQWSLVELVSSIARLFGYGDVSLLSR